MRYLGQYFQWVPRNYLKYYEIHFPISNRFKNSIFLNNNGNITILKELSVAIVFFKWSEMSKNRQKCYPSFVIYTDLRGT